MATTITMANGKLSAIYKDSEGANITEPLAYIRYNLADPSEQLSAYCETTGSNITLSKASIAERLNNLCRGIATLTENTYQNAKINYEVKLEGE